MFRNNPICVLLLFGLLAIAAGCTSSTEAVESAAVDSKAKSDATEQSADASTDKADGDQAKAKEDSTPTIIREKSTVTRKGNYIVALVNGQPITSYDVQRRQKFRQLRRMSTSTDATIAELVDESIKLQEATRRGQRASDEQVEAAFANFAKNNKSTPTRITGDLNRIGIGADHFKEYIRTQISWSRTVGMSLQTETRSKSANDALFEIRKTGGPKPETTEYTLTQIIFVIPADKRAKLMKTRKAEALAFSQRFEGCDKTFEMAKQLRDVAVKDLGRMMLPELPPVWSDDVQKTEVGKTTAPKETDKGVELLAVCKSRVVNDDRAAQVVTQSNEFSSLEDRGDAAADELLAKLRKSAVIIYR